MNGVKELKLNNTQIEIVGTVYGFVFAIPSFPDVFIQYISPIILRESINPTIPIMIAIIIILSSIASISWLGIIARNIQKTYHLKNKASFENYLLGLVVIGILSLASALFLKITFFG